MDMLFEGTLEYKPKKVILSQRRDAPEEPEKERET
jgi:hypothetical protein